MSSLFDSLADQIFEILKGSGKTLSLFGDDGNKLYEPKKARRMFAEPDKIMVSIVEAGSDSEVKLYLSSTTDVKEVSTLINRLRHVTTRSNVLFNVRKFGRELQPRDFAYQASMMESRMWGSTKSSYQRVGESKLIVRHCLPVREGVMGSRGRNILGIFVETKAGERFKFPVNHLGAGRAFARHIGQGGKPHDQIGESLVTLAMESLNLSRLSRYIVHSRNHLDESAQEIRLPLKQRLGEIRSIFSKMSGSRGYAEAALKLNTSATLLESSDSLDQEISRLSNLLRIDNNHALAESLMPAALITMGDDMNDKVTEMFHGIISLDDTNQLSEALISEYGHDAQDWAHTSEGLGFGSREVFEAALDYLDLMESSYSIVEDGDNILAYATKWSMDRFNQSGEEKMDKDQQAGIEDLAQGIRLILLGKVQAPDFPQRVPQFGNNNAKLRFYLDLYVGQAKLDNVATLNYVSSVIDKLAEGKKLDHGENTVALKLFQILEDDLHGDDVDESYYGKNPYDGDSNEGAIEDVLTRYEAKFDAEKFLHKGGYGEFIDGSLGPVDLEEPVKASYFIDGLAYDINLELEYNDLNGYHDSNFVNDAAEKIFNDQVKPLLISRGCNIVSEDINEFAQFEDKSEHHGFAAGDHVASDMGYGRLVSVEGDIAHVEFLNGSTRSVHVDDLDKVDGLSESNEEGELGRWFETFSPQSVLGDQLNELAGDPHTEGKFAAKAGQSLDDNPYNPNGQEGFAWARGFMGMSNPADVDIDEAELSEISTAKASDYFNRAAQDRFKAEKGAHQDSNPAAAARLARRDRGLGLAFKKMREDAVSEGVTLPEGELDRIFSELKDLADQVIADPKKFNIDQPIGQDDTDEENAKFMRALGSFLSDELKAQLSELGHGELGITYESEEVIGGDKGLDLIQDVKVDSDEDDDLETLKKNAFYRM